jgi:hypothetical protein
VRSQKQKEGQIDLARWRRQLIGASRREGTNVSPRQLCPLAIHQSASITGSAPRLASTSKQPSPQATDNKRASEKKNESVPATTLFKSHRNHGHDVGHPGARA